MKGEWETATIGDLCDSGTALIQTGPFGAQLHSHEYRDTGIPVLPTEAIGLRRIDQRALPRVDETVAMRLLRHRVHSDDILFARRGAQATGLSAIVDSSLEGAVCGTGAILLRVLDRQRVDPRYLSFALTAPTSIRWLRDNAVGAVMPNLNADIIRRLRVPIPSTTTQLVIASLLGAVDDKIELNRQMNETLEAMARALFKSWFVDFDPVRAKMAGREPFGMDAATAALFPATLVSQGWPQQPDLPNGWSVLPIRDVVEGVYDGPHATPPDATTGPIFLGIRNFRPTGLDLTEVKHIAESDWPVWTRRVTPTAGDIVFTYEATLGYFGMVPAGLRCCLGRRTALVRPQASTLNGNYLFHWFIGSPFQAHLQAHKNPGSTVDRILLRDFPDYPVLVPPRALVEAFAQMVAPMGAKLEACQAESRTLAELRDLLLPKLLSGELRIRDAEKAVEAVI